MNKRLIAVLAILTVAAAGAFAQIGLGLNAAIYSDTKMSFSEFGDRLRNGEGVFYGPFIELALGKTALGLSGNFSFYEEDWSYDPMNPWYVPMVDFDLSLYAQGHLIKYRAFLDPFLEVGLGIMGKDYANEIDDPDLDNPIMATTYFQAGGGFGINLGGLGIFIKGLYLFPMGTVKSSVYVDDDGDPFTPPLEITYDLATYPLRRLKLIAGAKIIL
ncbi:MAG TPA: hypothetical protein P5117_10705 [Spirochaetia bacterium]|nr:hypothetical protein [Spirochaetales bacterium]HRY81953.1 hypothetical protein [Spirochaetia bacterium]HRZ89938.1 hypothetical protein [Spirochaetia bacterium]